MGVGDIHSMFVLSDKVNCESALCCVSYLVSSPFPLPHCRRIRVKQCAGKLNTQWDQTSESRSTIIFVLNQ